MLILNHAKDVIYHAKNVMDKELINVHNVFQT